MNSRPSDSLFDQLPPTSPGEWALSMAVPADAGHRDELRGDGPHGLASTWADFFEHTGSEGLADLDRRAESLQRQLRDNGVSYNVYADPKGLQRPWALDLFPMIVGAQDWAQIEAGVLQRTRLLNAMMADLYGPQQLLKRALLPPALVQGHPGYLRALQDVAPPDGQWLRILGFDLARGPDGPWSVVAQHTQAPSGLGYLLENRIAIARQFPRAFAGLRVQRLAASYRALIQGMQAAVPEGAQARIALLTPGPLDETYFEHAYLARYLGLSLVEGKDLTVRDQRLFLKTLHGLEPVHALIKRLDDPWLDPLELRTDSTLGVPGLLQVWRAGHVLLANAPGSGPLESTALLGFLPAISERLLGEPLALPSLASCWCGEPAALHSALAQLRRGVIKPTYPQAGPDSVMGPSLTPQELAMWSERLQREPEQHSLQSWLPLSQTPSWSGDRLMPRSAMLRVFVFADGPGSWRVLPGGLVRLAPRGGLVAAMQRGASSADCWVLTDGPVDHTSLLPSPASAQRTAQPKQAVTSRAAENLFWLGRYTERAENTVRLAQIVLDQLEGEEPGTPGLLAWLSAVARENALVLADTPEAGQSPRIFLRSLVANLAPRSEDPVAGRSASVGFNLRALRSAAAQVRERLSREHWGLIETLTSRFTDGAAEWQDGHELNAREAQALLQQASEQLAAITGSQTDRMLRDDGWRLLSAGRLIERLATLSRALALGLECGSVHEPAGFEALVALFDSTITFHAQYQQRRDMVALVDLLVLDRDNPRSLAWVLQTLRARLARLGQNVAPQDSELAHQLPDPAGWQLAELSDWQRHPDGHRVWAALVQQLEDNEAAAVALSEEITRLHFSHADRRSRSYTA